MPVSEYYKLPTVRKFLRFVRSQARRHRIGLSGPDKNSYNDKSRCDKEYEMLIDAMEGNARVSGEELFKTLKKYGKKETVRDDSHREDE